MSGNCLEITSISLYYLRDQMIYNLVDGSISLCIHLIKHSRSSKVGRRPTFQVDTVVQNHNRGWRVQMFRGVLSVVSVFSDPNYLLRPKSEFVYHTPFFWYGSISEKKSKNRHFFKIFRQRWPKIFFSETPSGLKKNVHPSILTFYSYF